MFPSSLLQSLRDPSLSALHPIAAAQPAVTSSSPAVRTPGRRGPRGTRKISAQATKLESVDNSVDPLGPLGEAPAEASPTPAEEAPVPPQKETFAGRSVRPLSSPSQASASVLEQSVNLEDDVAGYRGPPPVQPPVESDGPKRQTQPSMSVEQAAKPTFEIHVGDPHKVGDLTSSHIVYAVRTKVVDILRFVLCEKLEMLTIICMIRRHPRLTANPSLQSAVDTVISFGFIIPCTVTTPEWLLPLRLRSKPLADLTPTL
jgi:hypothetical protein